MTLASSSIIGATPEVESVCPANPVTKVVHHDVHGSDDIVEIQ